MQHSLPLEDTDEKFLTLKEAANKLGLPTFKLRRAAKQGAFPVYSIYNTRRLVRLSEVIAAIERTSASPSRGEA